MGIKQFRERALARADALSARADRMDAELASDRAKREAAREDVRERVQVDVDLSWFRSQAARLREDHDELSARAVAVGVSALPRVSGSRALGKAQRVASVGLLLSPLVAGGEDGGPRVGPYEAWRDRIVVEELYAAKVARGESLTVLDRAALRMARLGSR